MTGADQPNQVLIEPDGRGTVTVLPARAVTPKTAAIGIRDSWGSSYRQSKVAMMNGGTIAATTPA